MRMNSPFKRLARDQRGVTAVEFAIIAPLVLIVYFATTQVILALAVERRVSHVASAITDLAAQNASLTAASVTSMLSVGPAIMEPFDGVPLKMRISAVSVDDKNNVKIDWSKGDTMTDGSVAANLPAELKTANTAYMVGEVEYHYPISLAPVLLKPVFTENPDGWVFKRHFYYKPRRGAAVECKDCI